MPKVPLTFFSVLTADFCIRKYIVRFIFPPHFFFCFADEAYQLIVQRIAPILLPTGYLLLSPLTPAIVEVQNKCITSYIHSSHQSMLQKYGNDLTLNYVPDNPSKLKSFSQLFVHTLRCYVLSLKKEITYSVSQFLNFILNLKFPSFALHTSQSFSFQTLKHQPCYSFSAQLLKLMFAAFVVQDIVLYIYLLCYKLNGCNTIL